MSASASKKKRRDFVPEQGSLVKKKNEKPATGKKILIGLVAAVVAVALIITVGMLVKREDYRVKYDITKPAMTVGDYEVSVPMFNYFYTSLLNNYLNSGYLNYGLIQQGVPLSEQAYMAAFGGDESVTWEDQLISDTKTQISNTVNMYLAAKEAGYTLTEEDNAAIEESMKAIKSSAKSNGYNFFGLTTDWFLADYFGVGCNQKNYREFAELTQICAGFAEQKEADFEPSDDDITAEYAENPNDYDLVTYALLTFNAVSDGTDDDGNATYSDDAIAAAKADAEAAVKAFDGETATVATKGYSSITQSVSEDAAKWLFDTAKEGEVKMFTSADERTFYVVRFDGKELNDYCLADACVISFAYDAEGAEPADGELSAAEKYAKLCDGLKDGISEEDFTARAEDCGMTASTRSVDRYAMNEQITAFLYDSARKDGDILTLADDESSTYYVIRFNAVEEDTYQKQLVKAALHAELEQTWMDEVYAANTAVEDEAAIANAYTDRTYG